MTPVTIATPRLLARAATTARAEALGSIASRFGFFSFSSLRPSIKRSFRSSALTNDKVLCVLYPDPTTTGYPPRYARDDAIPRIRAYPDGQTTPTPSAIDFTPGELLGCVSGELALRQFLEQAGHELVVTGAYVK